MPATVKRDGQYAEAVEKLGIHKEATDGNLIVEHAMPAAAPTLRLCGFHQCDEQETSETDKRKGLIMVARNTAVARQHLVRFYDDGPGGSGATKEKEQAFRDGFVAEARRVVRAWAHPPAELLTNDQVAIVSLAERLKKLKFHSSAEIEGARNQRQQARERHSVYRRGPDGPKTYLSGYLAGHEVPAARARGRHHALEYVIEPWRDAATSDVDVFDSLLLRPWLAAVEQWAQSPSRPEAPAPPPRLLEIRAATAHLRQETPLIPVTTAFSEPALVCPECGFEYVHPVAVECCPAGPKGFVRIDAKGVHLDPASAPYGRGVDIMLNFFCENGHLFTYRLKFHKGLTFLERTVKDLPEDAKEYPDTIWRD